MDVGAGVAALKPRHGQREHVHAGDGGAFRRQEAVGVQTAGAGDGEHALQLGVQIQQLAALDVGAVQREGTVHAHLLVHGQHRLDGGVHQRVVRQNGEDHRHGDAVIAAEGRFVRPDPLTVGDQIQTLAGHVLGAIVGLGADHVRVTLEDDGGGVLAAGGCLLPDDHVVARLLTVGQTQLLGEGDTQVADDLRVAAAVGHGAELLKIREHFFGLQALQNRHFYLLSGDGTDAAHAEHGLRRSVGFTYRPDPYRR